jgi:hypothetical protein
MMMMTMMTMGTTKMIRMDINAAGQGGRDQQKWVRGQDRTLSGKEDQNTLQIHPHVYICVCIHICLYV